MHHVLNRKPIGAWSRDAFLATAGENLHRWLEPFCAAYGIHTKRRVCLEIGCGAGRETGALAERFRRVIALDVSDEMLAAARENVTTDNVEFVRGDGITLGVVDTGSVSFAWSFIVFQHIPDPEVQYAYLREVGRVLRPGGWFLIHLYNDVVGYHEKLPKWQARAEAGELLGWSEAARRELEDDRYLTSMQTPVDRDRALGALAESGLKLVLDEGAGTSAWVIGGQRA